MLTYNDYVINDIIFVGPPREHVRIDMASVLREKLDLAILVKELEKFDEYGSGNRWVDPKYCTLHGLRVQIASSSSQYIFYARVRKLPLEIPNL